MKWMTVPLLRRPWVAAVLAVAIGAGTGMTVRAAPLNVTVSAPTITVPANYLLETDPAHATLAVRVATQVTRNQFCPSGALLLPCPPQEVRVRFTATLTQAGRPMVSASVTNTYLLDGNDQLPVVETVRLDPEIVLLDLVEYQLAVVLDHVEDPVTGTFQKDQSDISGPYRIAHFTGEMRIGEIAGTLQSLVSNPVHGGGSSWSLRVASAVSEHGHSLAHTLAVPPPLAITRNSRGGLTVSGGALEVQGPKSFDWSGWQGERGLTRLATNGYVADAISLNLPPGVGWRPANERRLRSVFTTSGGAIGLDNDLNPRGSGTGKTVLPMEFFGETYPIEFSSSTWSWSGGVLSLVAPATTFVRQVHYQDWQTATGALPDSNDGFWSLVNSSADAALEIRPGLAGGISTRLSFGAGEFRPHFPAAAIKVPAGGLAVIRNNLVDPEVSRFDGAVARLFYGKGCRDPASPGELPEPVATTALNDIELQVTPQAGFWGEGALATPILVAGAERHLEIGRNGGLPTHRTDPFASGRFYVPGTWVPRADGLDSPADPGSGVDEPDEDPMTFNPARYLLSGVASATNDFALEHPETTAYLAGAADYAGLNLRHVPGLQARSRIGGLDVPPYPLGARAKYYARLSGISGIHESASGPAELPAYGYDLELTRFGLSFLSNEPHDSRIEGTLRLPYPSLLEQRFERLMLSCCGNLQEGRIPSGEDQKTLAYWSGTRITTRSLRFTHDPEAPCDTDEALLELGITADVGHLDVAPDGFLYPRPDGTLTATDDLDRESHLVLPSLATLAGYPFTAVRRGYFNDYVQATNGPGWVNLAGLAGVSFFRDLTLQGHVLGSSNSPPPPVFLQGGWMSGGDTFFNQAGFDPGHRGFPPGGGVDAYRTGSAYLPRAQQVWFGLVPFDYPVRWESVTRSFRSPEPKGVDLAVLEVQSQIERLNAELADLRFSAFLNLSLLAAPEFLAEQGVSWITEHVEAEVADTIRGGLDRLSALLDARMRQILDDIVLPTVESAVVDPLLAALPPDGNPIVIEAALDTHLGAPLTEALQGLAEVAGAGTNLTEQASQALDGAVAALTTVRTVILQLQETEQLILAGLAATGIDVGPLSEGLPPELLDELEQNVGGGGVEAVGRLVEIRQAILELEASLAQLIQTLEAGQQFFEQLHDTVFLPITEYADLADRLRERLEPWLKFTVGAEPSAYGAEEIRARIRAEIRDAFAGSPVAASLQAVLRSWTYNADAAVREALDSAFQAINDHIVDLAIELSAEVSQALQPVKTFSSVVESINWDGRAHVRGDRLSLLRLDSEVIVNVPTPAPGIQVPVEFTGFFEFRELTSDGPVGCLGGVPDRWQEITVGASAGPASIFGAGNELSVEAKFTRDAAGNLLQMAGGLEMERQGPEIQVVGLSEFSATLSISPGLGEFYLSAFARGHWAMPSPIGLPVDIEMAGGALIGRTCSFEPFAWDPLAGEVLGGPVSPDHAFTGIYLFGEATFPLADASCVLRATLSTGARIFVNDPDFDLENLTFGGRLDGELSGEFLCLAKLKGSAFLQGSKVLNPPGPFRFDGGADVSGKIGLCPFCVELGGGVDASYVQGVGWSVHY